jgi:hypothetical protein
MKAKLIQLTSTDTKHVNKNFLSQLSGFSLHFSLGVEGWLWIRWVVSFGWFECFLLFVIVGARNKLRRLFSPFFSYLLNPTPNLYVDLIAIFST